MEEFLFNLRELSSSGSTSGAGTTWRASSISISTIRTWVLPDRNTIPFDVPFFQNLRTLMPEITHKHGALAIGGMTALFPSREDPELNARALAVLERDKKNEASLPDGRRLDWTSRSERDRGRAIPVPKSTRTLRPSLKRASRFAPRTARRRRDDARGTRAAVRTVIRYRNGVLNGKGASLLDGYMEDLATDRIYRLMIAQRIRHGVHTAAEVTAIFDEELKRLESGADEEQRATLERARAIGEAMISQNAFDPV